MQSCKKFLTSSTVALQTSPLRRMKASSPTFPVPVFTRCLLYVSLPVSSMVKILSSRQSPVFSMAFTKSVWLDNLITASPLGLPASFLIRMTFPTISQLAKNCTISSSVAVPGSPLHLM